MMKPLFPTLAALSAALALTACGGSEEKTYTFKDPNTGNTVDVQSDTANGTMTFSGVDEAGAQVSVTVTEGLQEGILPDWLPLYPGANVESSMSGGPAGEAGALVSFVVDAPPSDVASFYADKVKAAGVSDMMQVSAGETVMLGGERPDGAGVAITLNPDGEGGTHASITYMGGS